MENKLCDYGCGQPARHQMTSGKWCCENFYSKCPELRKRNSAKNIRKKSWSKGLTKETDTRIRIMSERLKGKTKGRKRPEHSKMMTGRKRPEQSEFMKKNNPMFNLESRLKVILATSNSDYKKKMSENIINNYKENPEIKVKISKTSKKMWTDPEFRKKIFKTWEEIGLRTPDSLLTELDLYYREVERFTNESLRNFDHKINPHGKKIGRGKGSYSVDHKYSKIMGFRNNIEPRIIGSFVNLEVIPFEENSKKKRKCSITKEELIKLYENII